MVRVSRISKLVVEIDGEEFRQQNGCINWRGYLVEVRLEDGRLDVHLPAELALEIGLTLSEKEEEADAPTEELLSV